jgi:hypothetical protein
MTSAAISDLFPVDPELMPVEVFIGGNGDVVLLQEHTTAGEESYLRICVRRRDAETIATKILEITKGLAG